VQEGYFNFDIYADIYDKTRKLPEHVSFLIDIFLSKLSSSKNLRILEIGCGTGMILDLLFDKITGNYLGIDISHKMLKIARERCFVAMTDVFQADSYFLPFREDRFDLVLAIRTIHLLEKWKQAINEIKRIIAPEGRLVIITGGFGKNFIGSSPILKEYLRIREDEFGMPLHIYGADYPDLTRYIEEIGGFVETIKIKHSRRVNLKTFFYEHRNQQHTWTKQLPKNLHDRVMDKLESFAIQKYGSLDVEEKFKSKITLGLIKLKK